MPKLNENKTQLSLGDAAAIDRLHATAVDELLGAAERRSNVVGVASGVKWKNGQPTGEPALLVLVTHKLPKDQLRPGDLVPAKIQEQQTDVLAIGYPVAGGGEAQADIGIQTLGRHVRPARGGYSVGHKNITAGTLGTCVYKILPGGSINPPAHGSGIPPKYYILSNNHVLANSNAANLGDPILQPGPFDGGVDPTDRIAILSQYVPITFAPAVPLALHNNLVDAAIAEGQFHDLDREVYWIGHTRGWRRRVNVTVGTLVQKTGRTTNYTLGRITAVNATIDVSYGSGKVARFKDQIVTTNISAGGDSGSLVTTLDEVAVGLLYAGSGVATILNQIENVRTLLGVEVAEQIL